MPAAILGAPSTDADDTTAALIALTRKVTALGRAGQGADALDAVATAVEGGLRPDATLATAVLGEQLGAGVVVVSWGGGRRWGGANPALDAATPPTPRRPTQ